MKRRPAVEVEVAWRPVSPNQGIRASHWSVRARRHKAAHHAFALAVEGLSVPSLPVKVELVRVSHGRLDDDNAIASVKPLRDACAHWLGARSDRDSRIVWLYDQEHTGERELISQGRSKAARPGFRTFARVKIWLDPSNTAPPPAPPRKSRAGQTQKTPRTQPHPLPPVDPLDLEAKHARDRAHMITSYVSDSPATRLSRYREWIKSSGPRMAAYLWNEHYEGPLPDLSEPTEPAAPAAPPSSPLEFFPVNTWVDVVDPSLPTSFTEAGVNVCRTTVTGHEDRSYFVRADPSGFTRKVPHASVAFVYPPNGVLGPMLPPTTEAEQVRKRAAWPRAIRGGWTQW